MSAVDKKNCISFPYIHAIAFLTTVTRTSAVRAFLYVWIYLFVSLVYPSTMCATHSNWSFNRKNFIFGIFMRRIDYFRLPSTWFWIFHLSSIKTLLKLLDRIFPRLWFLFCLLACLHSPAYFSRNFSCCVFFLHNFLSFGIWITCKQKRKKVKETEKDEITKFRCHIICALHKISKSRKKYLAINSVEQKIKVMDMTSTIIEKKNSLILNVFQSLAVSFLILITNYTWN